ncbi:MAG: hypothetical protein AAGA23_11830 [Pseudomonadota bacterium]
MSQSTFPPDAVEEQIPDYRAAEQILRERDPSFLRYVQQRRLSFEKHFGADEYAAFLDKSERTLVIAYARFALRHGNWGDDLHAYHNEGHALEILAGRINYLCEQAGADRLKPLDWVMLTLFAATHDLRQRETPDIEALVGNNERASIEEAHRIMLTAGFDREADASVFDDLELMIAGSTFNVQPKKNPNILPAEAAASCGALAPMLVKELDQNNPHWQEDPALKRRVRLTLIASDLDTANVSEPILKFANSAVRLCREIEFRSGRDLDSPESAPSVLGFLTRGQEAYFFELHQFDSIIGNEILVPMKETNAPLLTMLCEHMRQSFGSAPEEGITGRMILDEFMHKASEIAGRVAKT